MTVRIVLRRDAGKLGFPPDPWIRRRRVARVLGPPDPTALACVVDHRDEVLGWGTYSPDSEICARLLSLGDSPPPEDWLARRLRAALDARAALGLGSTSAHPTTGFREVNSEGDGLPGLVVDRYGDVRVVAVTTASMVARRPEILGLLAVDDPDAGLLWIAPAGAARHEGFEAAHGFERDGVERPDAAPETLSWREYGLRFQATAPPAQKTGAYHDQRDNRAWVARAAAGIGEGARVLDVGCHVGGFSLHAAQVAASVVGLDSSADALAHARTNAEANGLAARTRWVAGDMFACFAQDEPDPLLAGPFDLIVFDPPKIASSKRDVPRAVQAMQRTTRALLERLAPAGRLVLCSCSQHLDGEALDRVAMGAAAPRGEVLTRVARLGAGEDHPVAPGHLQGDYLRVRVYQRR